MPVASTDVLVNPELVSKLKDAAGVLKSLLVLLNVMRSASSGNQDLTKSSMYCKSLRKSGKLSRELTDRLDTVRYFIPENDFNDLVASLGCTWNAETHIASVKLNNEEEHNGELHAEKG